MLGLSGLQNGEKPLRLLVTKLCVAVNVALVENFFISTSVAPEELLPNDGSGFYPPGVYAASGSVITELTRGLTLTDAEIEMFAIGLYEGLSDPDCPFPLAIEEMLGGMFEVMGGRTAEECLADRAAVCANASRGVD